jgi:NADP-dependent 3-hydroxy acid dehydrogenase YdfG
MIDINVKGVLTVSGVSAHLPAVNRGISSTFRRWRHHIQPRRHRVQWHQIRCAAISDGLRHEVYGTIRTTTIEPGPLIRSQARQLARGRLKAWSNFAPASHPSSSVARAIAHIDQPADGHQRDCAMSPSVEF